MRTATEFYRHVQAQLLRLQVKPGRTYAQTAAALTATVDVIIERLSPVVETPPENPAPAAPKRPARKKKTPAPAAENAPAPSKGFDWRTPLGFGPGARPTPIQLKAALSAHLADSGIDFAYRMAKLDLGYD